MNYDWLQIELSDKNNFEESWVLPDTIIQPGDFILVFATEESRNLSGNYVIEASGGGNLEFNSKDGMRFEYLPIKGDFEISVT